MDWDIPTTLHGLRVLSCDTATVWRVLPFKNVSFVAQHTMCNIDLLLAKHMRQKGTLGPVNHLWASMTNQSVARSMGPPYTTQVQFISTAAGFAVLENQPEPGNGEIPRETENGQHEYNERASSPADRLTETSQIPWACAEPITNEKYADSDGNCEGHEGGDCADGKECANRYFASKNEQKEDFADEDIEPYSIYRCSGSRIDS